MIIAIVLLVIFVIAEAISDTLTQHFSISIFANIKNDKVRKWFDASESWKKKYWTNFKGEFRLASTRWKWYNKWYYKFFNIKYREKFPLSATLGIFITDAYHCLKAIQYLCIAIILFIGTGKLIVSLLFLIGIFVIFEIFYSRILINK